MRPVSVYVWQLQSKVVQSSSKLKRRAAASRTRVPSGTTSLPIPSPGMTAMRCLISFSSSDRADPLPGVRAQRLLVDIGAPARRPRDREVPAADLGRPGDQLGLPGDVVDVNLHDADVREHGAEVRRMQVREMAVI